MLPHVSPRGGQNGAQRLDLWFTMLEGTVRASPRATLAPLHIPNLDAT